MTMKEAPMEQSDRQYYADRDRSYDLNRPEPRGRHAVVRRDVYYAGDIPAGTVVLIRSTSNAGFRGIEASVTLVDEDRHAIISLGNLDLR